jgi:hypothetical protein
MRALQLGVSTGHLRARLAQPKAKLPEQALTLAHAKLHAALLLNPGAQRLAVPEVRWHADISRALAQHSVHHGKLPIIESPRSPGTFPLLQAGQPSALEPLHPVLDTAWSVAEQATYLRAGHTLRHEKDAMQAVIIPRFLGPSYFVLKRQDNIGGIDHTKRSHALMKPHSSVMRNYL